MQRREERRRTMRYDAVRAHKGFDILDAAEIWPRADAAGWAVLAEVEAAIARTEGHEPEAARQ
jgi:hypothetical protein